MTNFASSFKDLRFEDIASLKPRDRILKTAIVLFNERGVHTVGIDRIIAESGVSKRTFITTSLLKRILLPPIWILALAAIYEP